ncbi:MAG: hypothetical protein H6559_23255 [Lewinellaceae bacterium]|nr:hypothetical protein [Lewinellaceae bacterium]
MGIVDIQDNLKKLLSKDVNLCIDRILAIVKKESSSINELMLIKSRINSLKSEEIKGTVSLQEKIFEENKIRASLLKYIDNLDLGFLIDNKNLSLKINYSVSEILEILNEILYYSDVTTDFGEFFTQHHLYNYDYQRQLIKDQFIYEASEKIIVGHKMIHEGDSHSNKDSHFGPKGTRFISYTFYDIRCILNKYDVDNIEELPEESESIDLNTGDKVVKLQLSSIRRKRHIRQKVIYFDYGRVILKENNPYSPFYPNYEDREGFIDKISFTLPERHKGIFLPLIKKYFEMEKTVNI